MYAGIYPNGHGVEQGTHLTPFICILCGGFDRDLEWPFKGHVTFDLMDQAHDIQCISSADAAIDGDERHWKQPRKEANETWVLGEFLAHDKVSQHLSQGMLTIKISVRSFTSTIQM